MQIRGGMIMKKSNTSERLKQIMKDRNIRQADILEMARPYCNNLNVRLGRNDLSQYVSGKVVPGQDKLTILGLALNVSETWLMGYDVPMDREDFEKVIENYCTNPVISTDFLVLKSIRTSKFDYSCENIAGKTHLEPTEAERPSTLPTTYFATYAKDDSMIGKGIIKGDLLIFDTDIHNIEKLNGKIVLVSKDPSEEAVLRQIIVQDDVVVLQAFATGSTTEIYNYDNIDDHVELIGRLLRVNRSYYGN